MKNKLLILAFFSLLACDTANNVEPVFEKFFISYYGDEGDQKGVDMLVNDDGTMLLLGNSFLPSGAEQPFLIKVDKKGKVIWEKAIGSSAEDAVDIELISAGANAGRAIVVSNRFTSTGTSIVLHVIDQDGNTLNDGVAVPLHPRGVRQIAKSITPLRQSGFVITGYADGNLVRESSPDISPSSDTQDILVFSLDDNLVLTDTLVTKGGEKNGAGVKVFEMAEGAKGQFSIFGYSDRPYKSPQFRYKYTYDFIVSGIPVGQAAGTDNEENVLATAIETPDAPGGGFLMAGTSRTSELAAELYLVKLNSSLEITTFESRLAPGANMQCVAAAKAESGYLVLANQILDGGRRDIVLVKTGFDGNAQWSRSLGSVTGDDEGGTVKSLPDGRIAILGTVDLQVRKKMALIVLSGNGDL